MKKRTIQLFTGIIALNLMTALSGCQSEDTGNDISQKQEIKKEQKIENTMTAVYLKECDLFVELTNETLFSATIPKGEVYDEEGDKISEEDLNNGDVMEITGNGIIAESYPGQYHGIYKMQRKEKKNQEYIDKYQAYVEQFTVKKDPKEVPYLDITYRQPEAIVTAITTQGGYTWTYEENGEAQTVTTDCAHVLQWQNIEEMKISAGTEIELLFSEKPAQVQVFKWQTAQRTGAETTENIPEGEPVEVTENQEGNPKLTAEPEAVYLVEAVWENGEAQYGFVTAELK